MKLGCFPGRESLPIRSKLGTLTTPVPGDRWYIQRKERTGRKSEGEAIILVTEETQDAAYLEVGEKISSEPEPIFQSGASAG